LSVDDDGVLFNISINTRTVLNPEPKELGGCLMNEKENRPFFHSNASSWPKVDSMKAASLFDPLINGTISTQTTQGLEDVYMKPWQPLPGQLLLLCKLRQPR